MGNTTAEASTTAINGNMTGDGTTTTGGGASGSTVEIVGTMTVSGVSFDDLNANATLLAGFVDAVKLTLSNALDGVSSSDVAVVLSAGSVKIDYTITVPVAQANTLKTTLATLIAGGNTEQALLSNLADVPGLSDIASGTLSATAEAPGCEPSCQPGNPPASKAFSISGVSAGVALALASLAAAHGA